MHCKVVSILTTLLGLISSNAVAQPPKHPEAEKALARIILKKDYGDDLKFHSREVVTTARNDGVPGLNGLMFMRWKGDGPGTEVMASVQWFEKKDDLLEFYAKSRKRADYKLGEFDGTTLWKIGEAGCSWTDGEHFLVSLGGSPAPPPEMVKAWLAMIASKVAEVEKEAEKAAGSRAGEDLDKGYSRRGEDVELRQADNAVQAAREHVRNLLEGDFHEMEKTYAEQIVLMPGSELLKAKYGLAGAKGEKEAITVDRAKLLGTMKKSLPRPLVPANIVDKLFELYRFEPLKTEVGDFATVPPDPVDTPDGRLHFTIADGDVLFKVGPEQGDFLLFQFRQIEGRWKVVAEYLD